MVWLLAFSVQSQVEKYGAYVGVASFLGLALLSILYFSQARELRRLRDWAGRAPERDAELEARVSAQADDARRVQAEPIRRPAVATLSQDTQVTPPPVPATNGHSATAPLAVPMGPRPATAAAAVAAAVTAAEAAEAAPAEDAPAEEAAAAATATVPATDAAEAPAAPAAPAAPDEPAEPAEPAAGGDDDGTDESEAVEAAKSSGNGTGSAAAIPRATPRPSPPPRRPAQPLRTPDRSATVPPRRPAPARPARPGTPAPAAESRRGHGRGILIGVVAGVVVLGLAALAITQLGGSDKTAKVPNTTEPAATSTAGAGTTGSAGPSRAETVVVLLNGTTTDGLAAGQKTKLEQAGYSTDKIPTRTAPNQATAQSTVYYAPSRRRQASAVARVLQVDRIAAVDPDTQAVADNSSDPPVKADVVVVLGADKTP